MKEIKSTFTILNQAGLHARPCALLVESLQPFASEIFITKGGESVNGKSIMGVMMLAAECGSSIEVVARGTDAEEAIERVRKLIESKFDEN
jgi:phosphocarrier protein HPr